MGRQIALYLTPSDLICFETALRRKIELVALHYRSNGPSVSIAPSFTVEEVGKTWLTLLLVRPDDIGVLQFREIPEQGYWAVNALDGPVVEFARPYFDGTKMRRGRLYYETHCATSTGALVKKPEAFLNWASQIFKTARAVLRRSSSLEAFCGPEALALHTDRTIEFINT